MNQEFGKSDIAMCGDIKVRIVECIQQDEDGSWWYEIEPVEFNSFTREVPQSKLKQI